MDPSRRPVARLAGLWVILTGLRWLAALPVTEPRIFRDELLHWQTAKAFAAHQPFLFMGHPVDSPAVLYPAAISVVFFLADPRVSFVLAQGLNAAFTGAVVFPAYGLARELGGPAAALAAAAVAGLAPGGVYSALIMEESLYYPLFVLSCWLCFRVLTRGGVMDAAACALALTATYFTKPLGALLAVAYAISVLAWGAFALRRREQLGGLASRLLPLGLFAAALLLRRLLLSDGADLGSASEVAVGGLYTQELRGPLVPPLLPMAAVAAALCAALTLGTGATPGATILSFPRSMSSDSRQRAFVWFSALVVALYVLAAARHTLLLNDPPRMHERYLFAVGPLLVNILLLAGPGSVRRTGIALAGLLIVLTIGPLGHLALTDRTWIDAPSLTLAWQARRALGGTLAAGAFGLLAVVVVVAPRWMQSRPWASYPWMAGLLLLLNAGWYGSLYRQRYLDTTSRLVHRLQQRVAPTDRITVLTDGSDALANLAKYLKFWLDVPVTGYWIGDGPPPWYADLSGPADAAVDRTAPSFVVAGRSYQASCPGARSSPDLDPGPTMPVVVLEIPKGGCGKAALDPDGGRGR